MHQTPVLLLFSVLHFHHTVTVSSAHMGYLERSVKSLTLGHFFCFGINFMLNEDLKGNVDHVCIKHYYLQLPHLVSPRKMDWFITLSTLSLFSMTLTGGGSSVNLPKPVLLMSTSALKWSGMRRTIKLKIMKHGNLLNTLHHYHPSVP